MLKGGATLVPPWAQAHPQNFKIPIFFRNPDSSRPKILKLQLTWSDAFLYLLIERFSHCPFLHLRSSSEEDHAIGCWSTTTWPPDIDWRRPDTFRSISTTATPLHTIGAVKGKAVFLFLQTIGCDSLSLCICDCNFCSIPLENMIVRCERIHLFKSQISWV